MNDDPNGLSRLTEIVAPFVTTMAERTDEKIEEAITPLMGQITGLEVMVTEQAARIAVLEAQIAKLTNESKP